MPVLCIGPICIPMNLLLPFLLGLAHHYGWLKWIKREWVTLQHWRHKFAGTSPTAAAGSPAGAAACPAPSTAATSQQRYVCEGGVCRLAPAQDAGTAADSSSAAADADPSHAGSKASVAAAANPRQRQGSSAQAVRAVDL